MMKRKALLVMCILTLCSGLLACGNDAEDIKNEEAKTTTKEIADTKKEEEVSTIEGKWKCVDMGMEERGKKYKKEELEELYSMKTEEAMALECLDDGTGKLMLFGDEKDIKWEQEGNMYIIKEALVDSEEDAFKLNAFLKENVLEIEITETYMANGEEVASTMYFTLKH